MEAAGCDSEEGGAAAAGAGRRKPFFAWFPPPGEAERESLRVPCGGRRDPSGALALGFPLGPDFFRSPAAHSSEPPGYRPFYPLRAQADETRIFFSCFIGDGASPSPRELQDKIQLSFKGGYSSSFHFLQCSILAP